MDYTATPFCGEWNEDPENFLGWFLQCTVAADDRKKARNFIYYLQADSLADEWFEELEEEEKDSWVNIEMLFRRKWLKEEETSIKESASSKNEPQQAPTPSHSRPTSSITTISASTVIFDTQTDSRMPQHAKTSPKTHVATSLALALLGNTEKAKIHTTKATANEILQNFDFFPLSTSSAASLYCTAPSNAIETRESRSKLAGFAQNHQIFENTSIFSPKTPISLSPGILEPTNDVTQVYASQLTQNNTVPRLLTVSTAASSLEDSRLTVVTKHPKSTFLHADFESQPHAGSPASISIVSASETRPESSGFVENCQKVEKSPIFTQNDPDPFVSSHSKCANVINMSPASTTIVPALKRVQRRLFLWKTIKKSKLLLFFNPNHPKSPVSEPYNTKSLPAPSIAPTKHPCTSIPCCNIFVFVFHCHFAVFLLHFFSHWLFQSCYCLLLFSLTTSS